MRLLRQTTSIFSNRSRLSCASPAEGSRVQVLFLQPGGSRAATHSCGPGGTLRKVLGQSRDLGVESWFSESRTDDDSTARGRESGVLFGEMECLLQWRAVRRWPSTSRVPTIL